MSPSQSSAIRRAQWALRIGLGFIWIYEGLVPKLLHPITNLEKAVVAASGLVPNDYTVPFLHLLGVLEITLGCCVLAGIGLRPLCAVQAIVVAAFTVVIPCTAPQLLAHPFGLLTKNIPILGAIAALWNLARSEGDSSSSSLPGG